VKFDSTITLGELILIAALLVAYSQFQQIRAGNIRFTIGP
jgi:hypothetical protein